MADADRVREGPAEVGRLLRAGLGEIDARLAEFERVGTEPELRDPERWQEINERLTRSLPLIR